MGLPQQDRYEHLVAGHHDDGADRDRPSLADLDPIPRQPVAACPNGGRMLVTTGRCDYCDCGGRNDQWMDAA